MQIWKECTEDKKWWLNGKSYKLEAVFRNGETDADVLTFENTSPPAPYQTTVGRFVPLVIVSTDISTAT